MADPRGYDQNGGAPYYGHLQNAHAYQQGDRPQQSHRQPFTLNEALPYTPFTSVFPFQSGMCDPP